mmetsp:Transcript_100202/g.224532  ORF Transcript_100202/g.224532 Transcript_100202/m.224532 type:complete len:134 (-) Transcript_100202:94-495(-)
MEGLSCSSLRLRSQVLLETGSSEGATLLGESQPGGNLESGSYSSSSLLPPEPTSRNRALPDDGEDQPVSVWDEDDTAEVPDKCVAQGIGAEVSPIGMHGSLQQVLAPRFLPNARLLVKGGMPPPDHQHSLGKG